MHFKKQFQPEWQISAEASGEEVWIYLRCPGMSGGLFASTDEVEQFAAELLAAATAAKEKAKESRS
jgi:hypothetical protein